MLVSFNWFHGISRLLIDGPTRTETGHPTINHGWSIGRPRILHFLQHIARENTKGGGVSLFISQESVYSEMNDLCMITDYIECLFVKLSTKDSSYVVGVVYRPPNSNITLFNDKMNDILSKLSICHVMWWATITLILWNMRIICKLGNF